MSKPNIKMIRPLTLAERGAIEKALQDYVDRYGFEPRRHDPALGQRIVLEQMLDGLMWADVEGGD